ncbi:type II toxin-antitoxin system VapC family toxin [Extensimonas sp. H3M7-6]|jgi:predicted nucleic acid-binding protein|uniref:type II toxin-antitoxin system VapC family toxin n=1 Tax=Extensimonas soli TaxID=3031322 RepID=UPI0023DA4C94|nr:type II toxin-antitoxin system VapC family toxin [Extensimonas sp. H3M7-6]MDF1482857.1 type II toxin-antitoxin system VapC family toxin [Extensimonas sp. H3M7-6]
MRYRWLLDTCVLSEVTRLRPDEGVVRWLRAHGQGAAVAAVSFGEIHYGLACLPMGAKRNQLQAWALSLAQQFAGRVLVTDEAVWRHFGELKASLRALGRMQDTLDILIAASAMAHGLTVVTRNTRHFEDMGVPLLDPWTAPAP